LNMREGSLKQVRSAFLKWHRTAINWIFKDYDDIWVREI